MDEVQLRKSADTSTQRSDGGCSRIFAVLFGAMLLFVGIPCLILGLSNILGDRFPISLPIAFPADRFQSILIVGMGALFTVLGCIALLAWFQAAMARSRLGPVQIEVNPRTLRRGEAVTCNIRFRPRRAIRLTQATAKLAATEHTKHRAGDTVDSPAYPLPKTVFQASEVLGTDRAFSAGEEVLLPAAFSIPADAPCRFLDGNIKLIWTVTIELKLKGCPEWTRTVAITVLP